MRANQFVDMHRHNRIEPGGRLVIEHRAAPAIARASAARFFIPHDRFADMALGAAARSTIASSSATRAAIAARSTTACSRNLIADIAIHGFAVEQRAQLKTIATPRRTS
jgi:hypothetical protein